MSKYLVYRARVSRIAGTAVAITTAFRNPGGYPIAESFVLFSGENQTILAKRIRFDVTSFNESPILLDEDFMLEQAFSQAVIDLNVYMEGKAKDLSDFWDAAEVLKTTDLALFVQLWVRNELKQLAEVYGRTECEELKNALRPILELPKIATRNL